MKPFPAQRNVRHYKLITLLYPILDKLFPTRQHHAGTRPRNDQCILRGYPKQILEVKDITS